MSKDEKDGSYLDSEMKCKLCGKLAGHRENCEYGKLEADFKEAEDDYYTLVGLLRKRFPRGPDGRYPDFTVEEVLLENEFFREKMFRDLESDSIVGACTCLTKTPTVQHHKPGCKYRLIMERDRLLVAAKNAAGTILGLVDQQAMPDPFWELPLKDLQIAISATGNVGERNLGDGQPEKGA